MLAERYARWHDHGILRVFWRNFDQIAPGVYRSNHPTPRRFAQAHAMGITTILNLRGASDEPGYRLEKDICASLGITLIDIGLSARRVPPRDRLQDLIGIFRRIDKPFLMHCKSGADRAGLASAIWLMVIEGHSATQARRMLSLRYLHIRWSQTGVLDHLLDSYIARNQRDPIGFEDWVATAYDHRVIQSQFDAGQKPGRPSMTAPRTGWQTRSYLLLSRAIPLFAPDILRRRLIRGREDPARWQEKLGHATQPRPEGRLIWLHAVGLGEVLALRGLIGAMSAIDPALHFLITSTARSSAQVIGANLPARTRHQYLPIDAPRYLRRFLDHWQPNLSIWAEQDIWPGAIAACQRRGIPRALVNARMNADAFQRRARLRGLSRDTISRFQFITAQDAETASHLRALGADSVQISGSLKSAAPALAADPQALADAGHALTGRKIWLAASTHAGDEAVALATQRSLVQHDPAWLLLLTPRDPNRAPQIQSQAQAHGLTSVLRSARQTPDSTHSIWIGDTFGELGLWYRLAPTALIGGSFGSTNGHNPWEAAALGCAILHGPHTANFANDYTMLHAADAAREVSMDTLAASLNDPGLTGMATRAQALVTAGQDSLAPLARTLCNMATA